MKNQLAKVSNKKNFRTVAEIMRDPSAAAKLQNYIDEAVRCKIKILDEQESIKTLRQSAVDEIAIDPKNFNNLVSYSFNNNFDQKKAELEEQIDAIEAVTQHQRLS
jgi:hypothetical protein